MLIYLPSRRAADAGPAREGGCFSGQVVFMVKKAACFLVLMVKNGLDRGAGVWFLAARTVLLVVKQFYWSKRRFDRAGRFATRA